MEYQLYNMQKLEISYLKRKELGQVNTKVG